MTDFEINLRKILTEGEITRFEPSQLVIYGNVPHYLHLHYTYKRGRKNGTGMQGITIKGLTDEDVGFLLGLERKDANACAGAIVDWQSDQLDGSLDRVANRVL